MYLIKKVVLVVLLLALYLNFSEAGQQAAKEGVKMAGQAMKKVGEKAPWVLLGYATNNTLNVNVHNHVHNHPPNTQGAHNAGSANKPTSRPGSPKNG